jgi:hypothetical protein
MPAIMHQNGVIGKAKDIPMPTYAVALQLPEHVYLRLQLIAQATHQSFDDVGLRCRLPVHPGSCQPIH